MSERRVIVTRHAVIQGERRFANRVDPHVDVHGLIHDEVAEAFAAGRVANHRLAGFHLYGAKKRRRQLEPGQRFVWSEDGTRGYIVAREDDGDVVITALTRCTAPAQEASAA